MIDYETFTKDIEELSLKILDSGEEFDSIVAIAKGGLIPARFLARDLAINHIMSLTVRRINGRRILLDVPDYELKGLKILLVEDMIETGDGFKLAKKYLEEQGAIVKTSCMYNMKHSDFDPDFSLKTVYDVPFFFWE